MFDIDPADLDDTRVAEANDLAGLRRGQRWGFGGALLGGATAFAAIGYARISGDLTAADAGIQFGFVGALMGVCLATLGIVSERLRRSRTNRS